MRPVILSMKPASINYVGPLDIAPGALLAFGQRAMSAAVFRQNLYSLTRASDSVTQAFAPDALGNAPLAAINTFIGGSSATYDQVFDGSGNGHTAGGNGATWVANSGGGRPGYTGDAPGVASGFVLPGTGTLYVLGVLDQPPSGFGTVILKLYDLNNTGLSQLSFAQNVFSYIPVFSNAQAGGSDAWAPAAAPGTGHHIYELIVQDASHVTMLVDGVDQGATIVAGSAIDIPAYVNASVQIGDSATQNFQELLCYSAIPDTATRLALRQDVATYYSIAI